MMTTTPPADEQPTPRMGRPPGRVFPERLAIGTTPELKQALLLLAERDGEQLAVLGRAALTKYVVSRLGDDWQETVSLLS